MLRELVAGEPLPDDEDAAARALAPFVLVGDALRSLIGLHKPNER